MTFHALVARAARVSVAAFTAGMTAGRLVADQGVDRWGNIAVVRFGAAIAAAGLAGASAWRTT